MENNINISEIEIFDLMKKIGIPCSLKGYEYIKESVLKLANEKKKNNHYNISVVKDLYCDIAKKYDDTQSRAERAIRHAVCVAFDRGDIELLQDIFGHSYNRDKGKPTNAEFIYGITDYLLVYKRNKQQEASR